MRYAVLAIASLALAAPAFAQQNLEQPKAPHDGVGVDDSQPYMNDLLLRVPPLADGSRIANGSVLLRGPIELDCEDLQTAFELSPSDYFAEAAYLSCVITQEAFRLPEYEYFPLQNGPGLNRKPYAPEPGAPPLVRRLPLAPSHPNAQN